jgi:hypothetical protein
MKLLRKNRILLTQIILITLFIQIMRKSKDFVIFLLSTNNLNY